MTADKSQQHEVLYTLLIALVLVSLSFLLQANIGLNLADEGYVWYGTIRTAAGDIPMLDFRSYDPGRYYWGAAWGLIFGQGIMAFRLSLAMFQVIGLTLGLLAARRVVKNWWVLGFVGLLLLVWMQNMYHWQKLFEPSVAMAAVYIAVCLIEEPVSKRYFFSGLFVGLAALMGRNHGLYTFLAFFMLILFMWLKEKQSNILRRYGVWSAGIIAGYIPMLLMLLFVSGMYDAFLVKVLKHLKNGFIHTNIFLPVPWPWTVDYTQLDILNGASSFFLGLFFLVIPIFYVFSIIWSLRCKSSDVQRNSLLIASSFVGIFYLHHAFSRADLPHLDESIHPFLLGSVALLYTLILHHHKGLAVGLVVLILTGTVFAMIVTDNPYMFKLRFNDQLIQYSINGDQLWLPKDQADYIDIVKRLVAQHVAPREGLLIAPFSPGLYAILKLKAPVYDTYLLHRETIDKQKIMIQDLTNNRVNWVLLRDVALDGRDDLRFRNTHSLVWRYIMTNFEPVETPQLPSNEQFLRRNIPPT